MSNIIPPLLSDSPPPPPDIDDHEDDEYGDFTGTNNLSYDYDDGFSPPGSPLQLPTESFELDDPAPTEIFDINSNSKENRLADEAPLKDFCDKRKDDSKFNETPVGSNLIQDSISSNVTEQNVDDKLPISSNTTAPIIVENHKLPEENQESEINNEMIETDCDTNTTSNKTEINILSSRDAKENIKLSNIDFKVEKLNDSVSVNNDPINSNNVAKITINSLEDNTLPKQCKEIGNNYCSIVDSLENIPTEAVQVDFTETSKPLNENGVDFIGTSESCSQKEVDDVTKTPGLEEPISTHSQNKLLKINGLKENIDNDLSDDDFGAFTGDCADTQREINESDDFGEFTVSNFNSFQAIPEQPQTSNIEDDDDFGDFATTQPEPTISLGESQFEQFASFPPPPNIDAEDDFGDFATTSAGQPQSRIILLTEKQVQEKSKEIIVEMFPMLEQSAEDFVYKDLEANDKIFNQIKNITDTHALLYQWSKSASQNLLLRALNIDSRNILYGPGWNPSMPRFAANLSFTPLEPVKSEILTPTPAKEPNPPSTSQSSSVEALQFDLSELGLADPLESIPNKESNNPADTIAKPAKVTSTEPTPPVKLEPTILHSTTPHLQVSKVDLEQKPTATAKQDDFDDFVSYSSPPHRHNIILRETHISNKEPSKTEENDIVSWLEPTIVTPELSRKERPFVDGDEEFDDFQMVIVPHEDQGSKPTNLSVKPLNVLQPQPIESSKVEPANDDDFGDFTFSLPSEPQQATAAALTPAPLLEPLKPSVVQAQNTTSAISWPDPGITEDEISRFEALGYARVQKPVEHKPSAATKAARSKQNSLEDEEWSDFVSVQNFSPVHKLKVEKERSSTPDLPLSVLNLGHVQPTKQPIPVITPNGLVQTKLSSNMSLNLPNMMQQTNRVYPQPQAPHNPVYHISDQYASQAYGGFSNYHAQTKNNMDGDDDEWSDFVSHQSTNPNWINPTPNIITNPSDVFSSGVQKQAKKVPGAAPSRRGGGVSSVSIPDLDFLAPRNRTTQRK